MKTVFYILLGIILISCNRFEEEFNTGKNPPTFLASSPVQFDYSDPKYIGQDPLDRPVYLLNQIGFDQNNPVNYGYSYSNLSGDFSNGRIIKTEQINNLFYFTYFNENFQPIGTIILGPNGQMDFSFAGWGNDTMGCLEDVYSNQGWISVWATIQTAFIPQTGAAFAIACAINNL